MKKTKIYHIVSVALAVIAMMLPWGAVCRFLTESSGGLQHESFKTYSYFDLFAFQNANFAPLLCAVVSVVLLLVLGYTFFAKETKTIQMVMVVLSCAAFALSLLPLILYGVKFFNMTALMISYLLGCSAFMSGQRISGIFFEDEEEETEE